MKLTAMYALALALAAYFIFFENFIYPRILSQISHLNLDYVE